METVMTPDSYMDEGTPNGNGKFTKMFAVTLSAEKKFEKRVRKFLISTSQ